MGFILFGFMAFVFWLFGTTAGQFVLTVVVFWYLDNRYFGLLAALWAPVKRAQRISVLHGTIDLNPSDVRAMVELAELHLQGNRPQQAADYLTRAMSRGEDGARAHYLLGGALVCLGQHPQGRAELEAALVMTPNIAYGEPYIYLLEEAFATEGASSARIEELVQALEQFDSIEMLTRAGRTCIAGGRNDLGRKLLQDALRNYRFTPKSMRRRERRWLIRARIDLLKAGRDPV